MRQMSLSLPKYGEKKTIYASCSAGTAESIGADWEDSQLPAERRELSVVNRKKNSYMKMEGVWFRGMREAGQKDVVVVLFLVVVIIFVVVPCQLGFI